MQAALYYPHSSLKDAELIKSALLLWDRVEYIKPDWYNATVDTFPGATRAEKKLLDEAVEMIGVGREPTPSEKARAHTEIKKLVKSGLPEWFFFNPENPHNNYPMFPDKLLHETWDMLEGENLAGLTPAFKHGEGFHDWSMHKSLGLMIMSILAKVCAGTLKRMITDESDAYASWTRCLTQESQGQYGGIDVAKDIAPEAELLVTTSISVMSAKPLSLKSLVRLRRREIAGKDTILPTLREKYSSRLQTYLDSLQECKTDTDRTEIERQFKGAMRLDLRQLRHELNIETRKLLWSKDMAAGLIFTAGTFLAPYLTATIGVGALGSAISPVAGLMGAGALQRARIDYQAAKERVLKDHPMSWLYTAKPSLWH